MRDFKETPQYRSFQRRQRERKRYDRLLRDEYRSLYSNDAGEAVLRESIVAYIDDLGTKSRVASLTDGSLREGIAHLERLRHFLDGRWGTSLNSHRRLLSFSDNVVVGSPLDPTVDDAGVMDLVSSVVAYQCNMTARHGRFLRGGIALGPLYIDDRLVIGQGLVDAVFIEEHNAVYPRVLVAPDAVQLTIDSDKRWKRHKSSSGAYLWLLVDEDDWYFLDYLRAGEADELPGQAEEAMTEHRARVVSGLAAHSAPGRIRDKYVWAAHYHNYVASERFPSEASFPITAELTQAELASPRQFRAVDL